MPSSTIRRQMKNVVNNYSDAEKKVREATSNDPWGPSSSLMSEIADLTYNVVAFSEIMSMIWKRLNDHGKNWRHVYKALTLLDYLIKTGSERVALQCRENIFAIQTLKDFQYVDRDGKDQGINVREKSKQLVALLKDDDRLKGERSQALKTKERMAQVATSAGSSGHMSFGRGSSQPNLSTSYSEEYGRSEGSPASYHGSTSPNASSELEQARPQTSGEEELQLQLALAMSREAAEQEERMRRGDDLRLQMALEESRKDTTTTTKSVKKKEQPQSSLMDLMDVVPQASPPTHSIDPWGGVSKAASSDPWQSYGTASKPAASLDPWASSSSSASATPIKNADPWGASATSAAATAPTVDPWAPTSVRTKTAGSFDPFSTLNGTSKEDLSDFDSLRSSSVKTGDARGSSSLPSRPAASASPDPFDLLPSTTSRKTPESFLGPNAALVNLDSLVSKPPQLSAASNPFLLTGASPKGTAPPPPAPVNPFQVNQPQPPTLNQMRVSPMMGMGTPAFGGLPQMSAEPLPLSSMVPVPGMTTLASVGHVVPGMGVSAPSSLSMPQPLMSTVLPPSGAGGNQGAATTTNPFLL
ncbi:epsin-2 isoform X2 [Scleropages formosus]|uniref:epsin-2 isoform X2 n=1 Tax=Scleropages formosus TaxID=113540 RepID=UPI0008781722|nr:epsin-2 isoform X2 [Scleropages formosus]